MECKKPAGRKSTRLARDPFIGFVMSKKEIERDVLNDAQLRRIAQENFSAERITLVRDIFLFCCFTGLAYADIKKVKHTEITKAVTAVYGLLQSGRKQM